MTRTVNVEGRKFPAPVADRHLSRLRLAELELIRGAFPPRARVLELGGGNGFQAAALAEWGYDVKSIDIEDGNAWSQQFFSVSRYDGAHLPFPNASFDVVFSSNVLEHVKELQLLLLESARVLRTGGSAIHVLPTPIWRFWTILTHYPYLMKRVLVSRTEDVGLRLQTTGNLVRSLPVAALAWRAVVPQPHGEFRSSIDELLQYRSNEWRKRFAAAGFEVQRSYGTGIFYTGNAIFPHLSLRARGAAGRVLGSACRVFIMRHRTRFGSEGPAEP